MAHLPESPDKISTSGGNDGSSDLAEARAEASVASSQEALELAFAIIQKRCVHVDTNTPEMARLLELATLELANKFAQKKDSPDRYSILTKPVPPPTEEEICAKPASKKAMLAAGAKIGTLPTIFYSLLDAVNNRYSSSADIAAIITKDPALSAKLLRLINSPFYGLRNPVVDITRAVTIVGNGPLVMLTMGTVLVSSFKKVPTSLLDMRSFWMHSIATGVFARVLANRLHLPNPEHFFITGLLHDIGRLLIFITPPSCALHLIMESNRRLMPMQELEAQMLGFSHEELAGEFLHSWNCPATIIEAIVNHHKPLSPTATMADTILPVANTLASAMGYGSSGTFFVPPVDYLTFTLAGVTPGILPAILDEARQVITTMSSAMLSKDEGA